jgi:hypothetical protein
LQRSTRKLVLADFTNSTGDAVFDGTLREALALQIEQSPFLRVLDDAVMRQDLQLMRRSPQERTVERPGLEGLSKTSRTLRTSTSGRKGFCKRPGANGPHFLDKKSLFLDGGRH